jgi:hypothetical protein
MDIVMKLAPFYIKLDKPDGINTYIKYLSCCREDENQDTHLFTLNTVYYVYGFTNNHKHLNLGTIVFDPFYAYKTDGDTHPLLISAILPRQERYHLKFTRTSRVLSTENATLIDIVTDTLAHDRPILEKLIGIACSLQRNRRKVYDTFANFTLRMCRLHSIDTVAPQEGVFENYHAVAKYMHENQTIRDNITLYDENRIPKMTVLMDWTGSSDYSKVILAIRDKKVLDRSLINISTLVHINGGVIYDPENSVDITEAYNECTLLSRVMYNTYFNLQTGTFSISEQYKLFESFAHVTGGQEFEFTRILFSNIEIPFFSPTLYTLDQDIAKITDQTKKHNATQRNKFFQIMLYGYFIFHQGNIEQIKTLISVKNEVDIEHLFTKTVNSLELAQDIIIGLCPDSVCAGNLMYHFTEISREVCILRDMSTKLQLQCLHIESDRHSSKLYECIIKRLVDYNIINSGEANNTTLEYWQDFEPIAKEYAVKLALYAKHADAISSFMFDMMDAFKKFKDLFPGDSDSKITIEIFLKNVKDASNYSAMQALFYDIFN